jgi:hypothetical protein
MLEMISGTSDHALLVGEIQKLSEEESVIQWRLGDLLIQVQAYATPGISPISRLVSSGDIPMSVSRAWLRHKTSSVFPPQTRKLSLPWVAYSYCVAKTDNPREWIDKALSSSWNMAELTTAILKEEAATKQAQSKKLSEYEPILNIMVKPGTRIVAYCHFTDAGALPYIKVIQSEENYNMEEAGKLADSIKQCVSAIEEFVGGVEQDSATLLD